MSLAAGLQPLQYSDRLDGLLACGFLLFFLCFANFLYWNVCWLAGFWMLVLEAFFELGSHC